MPSKKPKEWIVLVDDWYAIKGNGESDHKKRKDCLFRVACVCSTCVPNNPKDEEEDIEGRRKMERAVIWFAKELTHRHKYEDDAARKKAMRDMKADLQDKVLKVEVETMKRVLKSLPMNLPPAPPPGSVQETEQKLQELNMDDGEDIGSEDTEEEEEEEEDDDGFVDEESKSSEGSTRHFVDMEFVSDDEEEDMEEEEDEGDEGDDDDFFVEDEEEDDDLGSDSTTEEDESKRGKQRSRSKGRSRSRSRSKEPSSSSSVSASSNRRSRSSSRTRSRSRG